jgi:hypothetical protein
MIACMVQHGTAAFSYCHFSSYLFSLDFMTGNQHVRDERTHPYFNIAAAAASGKEDSDTDGISR